MILHIVPDDKFIDMAYNMFEKVSPDNNEFMMVSQQNTFKYIKTTPIIQISLWKFFSKKFAKNLDKYEFIVIHVLRDDTKKLILNADENIKFLWIGWGGDYYSYINKNLLLVKTTTLKMNMSEDMGFLGKNRVKTLRKIIKNKTLYKGIDDIKMVFDRIDYFAPVLYEDYKLIKENFKTFNPEYLDWNYGTLEDDLVGEQNINIRGNNILLGNSATFENNHIEVIDLLKKLDLTNKKVICPLSYGKENYAKEIINYGQELLGKHFEPLTSFLKLNEYNKIISTCSVVIMNHIRQQAVGNIIIMMYFGAKVFLNKENSVYDFFINSGAIIFSIDELNNENIDSQLTKEQIGINREVLTKYWSREVMINKTKELIKILTKNNKCIK